MTLCGMDSMSFRFHPGEPVSPVDAVLTARLFVFHQLFHSYFREVESFEYDSITFHVILRLDLNVLIEPRPKFFVILQFIPSGFNDDSMLRKYFPDNLLKDIFFHILNWYMS